MFNQERRKFLSRTAMAAGGLAISPLADLQASVLSDGVFLFNLALSIITNFP